MKYQLPAILWAIVIFVSSSIPSDYVPQIVFFKFDKLVHFGVYFLLAFFTYRAIRNQTRWTLLSDHALLFTVVLIALYGATDELHQYFVPGRSADLFDLLADTLGACLLVAGVWWRERARPEPQA